MKHTDFIATSFLVSVGAFAPSQTTFRSSTSLSAKKEEKGRTIFGRIADLDLFAPVSDQNDYGARKKKVLKTGTITKGKSYVPSGMTAAQYNKVRKNADVKKALNYQRNVKKAGKFEDFTEWYKERGTDSGESWINSVTRGHRMVKTKFDWSGQETNDIASFASPGTKGKKKGKGKK